MITVHPPYCTLMRGGLVGISLDGLTWICTEDRMINELAKVYLKYINQLN